MSWLPSALPRRHECLLPTKRFRPRGRRWQCDECKTIWQLTWAIQRESYSSFSSEGKAWRKERDLRTYDGTKLDEPPIHGHRLHPGPHCGCMPCREQATEKLEREVNKQLAHQLPKMKSLSA